MTALLQPALFVVAVWWSTTGLILFLDRLPPATFRWSLAAATVALVGALLGLEWSSGTTTPTGACVAFASAVVVWGWLEMTFLMGAITGPRRHACTAHCLGGWSHFVHAVQAIAYHELAGLCALALVLVLCRGEPNEYGLWSFVLLWCMRLSAKLNLFFGVPNVGEAMLPPHLKYLAAFFRKRAMNALFPVSVTLITVLSWALAQAAWDARNSAFDATGLALLATLSLLALLEHWMLTLPLPADALWHWLRRLRRRSDAAARAPAATVRTP